MFPESQPDPAGPRPASSMTPEAVSRRLKRLRGYRTALAKRRAKIEKAGAVVAEKYKDCERILAIKGQTQAAHRATIELQRKVEASQAATKIASLVFYSAAAALILAGLNWGIAQKVAPTTYIARAVISVDSRGREMSDGELAEWQTFHEQLLTDPRMIEIAAGQMKRRGIEDLGNPGALRLRLQKDMSSDSPSNGSLVVELAGEGAHRTERVLDTYITSLASHANSARDRRVDGAATSVSESAKAGQDAVDDKRLAYAGAGFVGSIVVSLGIGVFAWKRLVAAQTDFDREAKLERMMEEGHWAEAERDAA